MGFVGEKWTVPEAIDGAPVVPGRPAWAITQHMRWLGARMAELDRDLDATIRSPLWRANNALFRSFLSAIVHTQSLWQSPAPLAA